MNTIPIWIPSMQESIRFKELSITQYRSILKQLNSPDIDFTYTLNSIIADNIISTIDWKNTLTILDRFIIFVAYKSICVSPKLSLTKKCNKCAASTNFTVDLHKLILDLAKVVDKSFKCTMSGIYYKAECDIPSIYTEEQSLLYSQTLPTINTDFTLDNEWLLYTRYVKLNNVELPLYSMPYADKLQVLRKLPAHITSDISNRYIRNINNMANSIKIMNLTCTHMLNQQACGEKWERVFDVYTINSVIRDLYTDNTNEQVLLTIHTINSAVTQERLTPMELEYIFDYEMASRKDANNVTNSSSNPPSNIFEEYRAQTENMAESPSSYIN